MENITDDMREILAEINVARHGVQSDGDRRATFEHLERARALTEALIDLIDRQDEPRFLMAAE